MLAKGSSSGHSDGFGNEPRGFPGKHQGMVQFGVIHSLHTENHQDALAPWAKAVDLKHQAGAFACGFWGTWPMASECARLECCSSDSWRCLIQGLSHFSHLFGRTSLKQLRALRRFSSTFCSHYCACQVSLVPYKIRGPEL